MAMEKDIESRGSIAADLPTFPAKHYRRNRKKLEVLDEVLSRLQQLDNEESMFTDFEDQLWLHFERLPLGYASHLNVERAADVLTHIRLLHCAEDPAHRPAFEVRLVQVHPIYHSYSVDSECLGSSGEDDAQSNANHSSRLGIHPPPAFGPSPNIEALLLQVNESRVEDGDSTVNHPASQRSRTMHEITFATLDKPKLLSQLTSFLLEIGLHIKEAHAFLTLDGFALVVLLVDGWPPEETEQLRNELEREILKSKVLTLDKGNSSANQQSLFPFSEQTQTASLSSADYVKIPTDGADVWEIDASLLKFENKVGSGSFGDFYKGTYCSQEVAIKVLKPDFVNKDVLSEFAQEVFIMRKIRHKYVVQFIGACTRRPNLCILTEFMSRGSVYDFLHKQGGAFKFPTLLRVALDISKGMNYLHQNNIIHGDLKTANLLMDEHEVVKVADFGVATVQTQSRVMTVETGTYRWMAPEVIEHEPYDHKADVFSFGVVLWELLTGEVPYLYLTPLQAAVGVVQQGLRPTIPKNTNPKLVELLERCWHQNPTLRPDFSGITEMLQLIGKEVGWEGGDIDCRIFLSTQKLANKCKAGI